MSLDLAINHHRAEISMVEPTAIKLLILTLY